MSLGDLDGSGTVDVVVRAKSGLASPVRILLNADPNQGFVTPRGAFSTLTENQDGTFT